MGAWLPDGTKMVVDPDADILPMDLCVIHLHKDAGTVSRFLDDIGTGLDVCKLFLRQHSGGVLVCALNPVLMMLIPDEEIEAMHRVAGFLGTPGDLLPETRELMERVVDFCQFEPMTPINPGWHYRELAAA